MRAVLRSVWRQVIDPPHQTPVIATAYIVTMLTGLVTVISPPASIAAPIGPVFAHIWAICLFAGGLVGLATVFAGWWWLERLGIVIILVGGLGVYALVITMLHIESPPGASRLTQLGVLALAALLFILRLFAIRGFSYAPRAMTER